MWSIVLMGLAGLLVGGALSFRQQKSPRWVQVVFYVLAGMALLAAYLLTLPACRPAAPPDHLPTLKTEDPR
jgi:hypothetical protein